MTFKWAVLAALMLTSLWAGAEVTVKDYLNRPVTLEQPAKRIVALAPHIVENLYTAGAGDALVGAVDYSDYPEAAKNIPRVGSYTAFSVEAIVAMKPDLVIVWVSTRGASLLQQLEALGINTYANDPRTLSDVARSIRDYGVLAGTSTTATQAASRYEQKLGELKSDYAARQPVSVLYQVWYEPLQTLNDKHIISDVIRMCGGVNSFADAPTLAPRISYESVLARNPEAIIASGMGEGRPDWLDNWRRWPQLTAVESNNLFYVPPDIIQRHTYRILDGAEQMCQHIQTARDRLKDPT